MMTAKTRKTSLKNKQLCSCDYFAIIRSCLHSIMLAKYHMSRIGERTAQLNSENQRFTVVCSSCHQNRK